MPPSRSAIQEANDHIRQLTAKLAEYEAVVKAKDDEIMRMSMHLSVLQEEVSAAREVIVQRNSEIFRLRGKVALADYIIKCRPLIERLLMKMSRVDGSNSASLSVMSEGGAGNGDRISELLQQHEQVLFGVGSEAQFASVFGADADGTTATAASYGRTNSVEAGYDQHHQNGTSTPPMFNFPYNAGDGGGGAYGH
eukprot:Opistho-1_new@5444